MNKYAHFGCLIQVYLLKLDLQHFKLFKVLYECFLFQWFPYTTVSAPDWDTHRTWMKLLVKKLALQQ